MTAISIPPSTSNAAYSGAVRGIRGAVARLAGPAVAAAPLVGAGQTCPPPQPVADAISLSFGPPLITLIPPSASITATVTNSSDLTGKCTYDADPLNIHRDFTVPAHGGTDLTFNGLALGITYHAKVTCNDSSGKQKPPIGGDSKNPTF